MRLDKKIALRSGPARRTSRRRPMLQTGLRAAGSLFSVLRGKKLLNPRTRGFASIIVSMRSLADSLCCAASNLPMENRGGEVRA